MFDLNLFKSAQEPITTILKKMTSKYFDSNIDVISSNNFFLLPICDRIKPNLQIINQYGEKIHLLANEFIYLQDRVLINNDLILAKIISPSKSHSCNNNNYQDSFYAYQNALLEYQIKWLKNYADFVKEFLSKRIAEGKPIIQYETIRFIWAELIEHLESLNNCNSRLLAKKLIRESCEILAKFCGGRGFLEGQAIETLWVFEITNKIFFSEGNINEL